MTQSSGFRFQAVTETFTACDRATALLASLGLSEEVAPDPAGIAHAIRLHVVVAPPLVGETVYVVGSSLCVAEPTPWSVATAIALWAYPDRDSAWRNAFAGALIIPRSHALAACYSDAGRMFNDWAHIPQTCVALRLGELGVVDVWIAEAGGVRYARARRPPPSHLRDLALAALADGSAREGEFTAWRIYDGAAPRVAVLRWCA